VFEYLQKLCIMENERALVEYEKKDLEKKLTDQKNDSELLRGQLRVCNNVLYFIAVVINISEHPSSLFQSK